MHSAKIIAVSLSPEGVRLTSMELTYPRIIHAEMMTHRVFSRNAASSRAIPVQRMIRMVQENPYIPSEFGANQSGMQAGDALSGVAAENARSEWLQARDNAVFQASKLLELGVHKQLTNRLLEPFQWYTALFTGTEWSNFFHLRCHPAAHPDIQALARKMRDTYEAGTSIELRSGEWHLPYVDAADVFTHTQDVLKKVSAGRCARLSYLTHDGTRDSSKDIALHDQLLEAGHMSPFEHQARPSAEGLADQDLVVVNPNDGDFLDGTDTFRVPSTKAWCGNFRGWVQYRKTIPYEHDVLASR